MGICPVAMELLPFKLPWLPCVVSWECEALPAKYPLYVVVVVAMLQIWMPWLPQFGGGSPWWLQHTWRGAAHLLPCSLHKFKKNCDVKIFILLRCCYVMTSSWKWRHWWTNQLIDHVILSLNCQDISMYSLILGCKRSLGQGNAFTSVSVCLPQVHVCPTETTIP